MLIQTKARAADDVLENVFWNIWPGPGHAHPAVQEEKAAGVSGLLFLKNGQEPWMA
jgi:hypothetical protein